MIQGFATPEGTSALADKGGAGQYREIGDTGLMASQAGFGCYRVSVGVEHHEAAMRRALSSGVNVIDTSTNYADGGSEMLVGRVMESLIESGELARENVVVVSKVGYLQGQNYALSQERKKEGRPFEELVLYGEGLEHCMHPEFIREQLDGSLERLRMETLDFYLLHNPEYYLDWAHKNGMDLAEAREEYYRRIENAFSHLEKEADAGRIRYYGISSNTFPGGSDDPEFTSLSTVCGIAESVSPGRRFRLIQLPMNAMETGAELEKNQPDGRSVLAHARDKRIGVLINRPLNAFFDNRLIRLAGVDHTERMEFNEIIRRVRAVGRSEARFWRKMLPDLDIEAGLKVKVKEQLTISSTLTHYWRNFGSHERWRQVVSGTFLPRVRGVMEFLEPHRESDERLAPWMTDHMVCLEEAFEAVGSIYSEKAAREARGIERVISAADPDWSGEGTLSQKAIRAIRSTTGVSSVLVGMRRERYVEDVLEELRRPLEWKDRVKGWENLREGWKEGLG